MSWRNKALWTLCCVALIGCASLDPANGDLSVYRSTKDQPGHELVNTEQFLVPIGARIIVRGIDFESGSSTLTPTQRLVVQQIFNCIEEVTENTVNDTNAIRVAKFRKMKFEIRGYGDFNNRDADAQLGEERANAVSDFLKYLGTPPWRLKPTAATSNRSKKPGRIEFVRIQ